MDRGKRTELLLESLKQRILVLDGATGTLLQQMNLEAKDFGGEEFEGCNENLVVHCPSAIEDVHRQYLDVGVDIIETNSFGGTPLVLAEYDLQDNFYEINVQAAKIARNLADEYTEKDPSKPRFVAGSMGPTTKAISVTGGVTFNELVDNFEKQAVALYDGGVDYFLVETCQDTRNIKAAILGIHNAQKDKEHKLPIGVSVTIEPMGTMLAGQAVDALVASLAHEDLLYIGLNCATGPEFMTDHIRSISDEAHCYVSCLPNAGLPDEDGNYLETPEMMCRILERFVEQKWVNILGGCCGTSPRHIGAFVELVKGKSPRIPGKERKSFLSGVDYLHVEDEKRPILVGERTNVIGSKKFRELIAAEQFDEAAEIAKAQVKKGAEVIDICLANPDRDEILDMEAFLEKVIQKIRVPLMIDSTDREVVEMALTYSQGKAIINSINLEEGEKRFNEIVPLAKKYGAALVVGLIDETGMAVSRERKIEVAKRSYDLLVNKFGYPQEDIYFDALVFPCATGDDNYLGSAEETIEGLREIKKIFPASRSVMGLSNISFGLPPAGREVLNSVFTYHCVQAGLDLAMVNSEKLRRYNTLSEEEITLADDLLFNRNPDAVTNFATFYRGKKTVAKEDKSMPKTPVERIPVYILEGMKNGLKEDLLELLKEYDPMSIINGHLMNGMKEVGKLFNANKLIVAEVLQSAEVMKEAVNILEPYMEHGDQAKKGKFLLATVKGDVHDIGKNLVDIVLSNNGFEVINLGIKITSEQLIEAVKKYEPDMIGLSGLLVKSAQQMAITASDLTEAGINLPILVGGAALSKNFVHKKIAPNYEGGHVFYSVDAMGGLELANIIMNPTEYQALIEKNEAERAESTGNQRGIKETTGSTSTKRSSEVSQLNELPTPPDFDRHVITNTPLDMIFSHINPLMLYTRHLGIKGKYARLLAKGQTQELEGFEEGEKAIEIFYEVEKVKDIYRDLLKPRAIYQFFNCESLGNQIRLKKDKIGQVIESFSFARQSKDNGLCLSDYVTENDTLGMFIVSVGEGIREKAEELKVKGEFLHSHILQALALETAEGYAELMHAKLRSLWGFPDEMKLTVEDRFKTRYRGKRYSFGYPACPNLDDQKKLFALLKPEEVNIRLTDGCMMDPESSVSALVFHHPEAKYFAV